MDALYQDLIKIRFSYMSGEFIPVKEYETLGSRRNDKMGSRVCVSSVYAKIVVYLVELSLFTTY